MSFILEALKRSENERQRQTGPGLAAAPEGGGEQRRSPWLFVIGVLLLVNLAVLAFLLTRPGDPPAPTTPASATAPTAAADDRRPARPAATDPAGVTRPATSRPPPAALARTSPEAAAGTPAPDPTPVAKSAPRGDVRSLSAEVAGLPLPEAEAPPAVSAAGEARVAEAAETPTARPAVTRTKPAPASARPAAGNLPTVQELTLRGEFSGRPLNLELHVYYDDPSRRLVFINGSKYREGERIDDDLRVAEIVPEGVVLDDGRQRFLLPST